MENKKAVIILLAGLISLALTVECKAKEGFNMRLSSPVFEDNAFIPAKFTCKGQSINPPLIIQDIPKEAKSLVLIMDDPDAPSGTFVHWVVYDIPVTKRIDENSIPGKQGVNTTGKLDYLGPCPPTGVHRYFFKIYALDKMLNLDEGISKSDLEKAMPPHILDRAELVGLYQR